MKPRSKNILYVEDEPLVQETIVDILSEDGHTVDVASNVKEAIEKLKSKTFELALLDYTLGEETSEEIINFMKSDKYYSEVPIIVMSGDLNNTIAHSIRSNIDAILIKPVKPEDLCFKIHCYSVKKKI